MLSYETQLVLEGRTSNSEDQFSCVTMMPLSSSAFHLLFSTVSLFILVSKVTADLIFITKSVNLSKIKPVATELSRTYDHIAVGRKKSY